MNDQVNGEDDDELSGAEKSGTEKQVKKLGSVQGSVLGAAMLGLGEVIEPEKTKADIEITASADASGPGPLEDFNFGELPELG